MKNICLNGFNHEFAGVGNIVRFAPAGIQPNMQPDRHKHAAPLGLDVNPDCRQSSLLMSHITNPLLNMGRSLISPSSDRLYEWKLTQKTGNRNGG